MRRALLLSALTTLPLPLWADDFYGSAPVVSAILYPEGVTQTHRITVDLPAGQHRLFLPAAPFENTEGAPTVTLVGGDAHLGPVTILFDVPTMDPGLLTPAQAKAKTAVETAENALVSAQDNVSGIADSIASLKNELTFLESISAPDDTTSVEELKAIAALVGSQTQDVRSRMATQQVALREAKDRQAELEKALTAARKAYDRLSPPDDTGRLAMLPVELATPQLVEIETTSVEYGGGWAPNYDLKLAEPAQDNLTITRFVWLDAPQDAVWDQIDVTLSTQRPSMQMAPSEPRDKRAHIRQPRPEPMASTRSLKSADMAMEAPIIEPELVVMDEARAFSIDTGGVAVTYHYPGKVSASGGDVPILELGSLTLPVTPEIYAVPRRDDTAFLVAQLINDTKEPLLGGMARIYRGDSLVGHTQMPFLAAGDDATLPFGPIEGIRLAHVVADNETGDRGIITTTNTREQDTLFRVTNLTGKTHEVKTFYPLTYSEQEDLEVRVSATPRPDESNHDDKRGLSVWNLSLAPGEEAEVTINTRLSWPDGWMLNWRP
ncbi:mucoidy inhibitor MuiA family protein [Aliiroseovarius crassostreae]|uniref:mucoidy inhibitor MuiA family protein n=1 Tax=Aliiroseovarius crassostreae TaxID=154981 RepID=UPI00220B1713|nr:mucoidy inhibitor MuiA family protein [Aliiroseovarius crassostreae]UWP91712.1 mucoidy inhibitor MuiA family protein [Aliiroseovarius crassostreae]